MWSQSGIAEGEPIDGAPDGTPIYPDGYVPEAPLGRLEAGSLVGPGGRPVAVKVIDDAKVDGFVGDGNGWLLPVKQLKPSATYKATVVPAPQEGDVQRQFPHSWTFRASRATLDGCGHRAQT